MKASSITKIATMAMLLTVAVSCGTHRKAVKETPTAVSDSSSSQCRHPEETGIPAEGD